jgi:Cys-rich four helix bundle protein (predicted Tat secretion target)
MKDTAAELAGVEPGHVGRREFLMGAAAAAAAGVALAGGAQAAEPKADSAPKLAALAASCVQTGDACISHCLSSFSAGDTKLAACARSVTEMVPVCQTLGRLAELESAHLRSYAAVCREVCDACEQECRKHEKDHAICKECGDACRKLSAALKSLAG